MAVTCIMTTPSDGVGRRDGGEPESQGHPRITTPPARIARECLVTAPGAIAEDLVTRRRAHLRATVVDRAKRLPELFRDLTNVGQLRLIAGGLHHEIAIERGVR